ncbi:MAG TPA: ribonuclease D, partial [Planctomycetaceae bacterium]|nr:ribonuclease D [Planctomycetaceae bacterium]
MSHVTIRTDSELEQFCQQLVKAEWIALDTEFVAERTYRPQLCLVQVATADEMAIIDPLAVTDMRPFWEALSQPGHETIVHAGRGELE